PAASFPRERRRSRFSALPRPKFLFHGTLADRILSFDDEPNPRARRRRNARNQTPAWGNRRETAGLYPVTIQRRPPARPQPQETVMTNKICELKLNEVQAVVGGVSVFMSPFRHKL